MNYENLHNELINLENFLLKEVSTYEPLPETSKDYLESEQFKILKKYMNCEKNSIKDLINLSQWKEVLMDYLPNEYKYMACNLDLIDYPFEEKTDYNQISEEYYHNIKELFNLALTFINEKNKGEVLIEPIIVGNVLKHITEAIVSEVYKFKFYKEYRRENLKVSY